MDLENVFKLAKKIFFSSEKPFVVRIKDLRWHIPPEFRGSTKEKQLIDSLIMLSVGWWDEIDLV